MSNSTKRAVVGVVALILVIVGIFVYNAVAVTIKAGEVGYRYDRTVKLGEEGTIPGTSVIDKPLTGRAFINPITQDILIYPTTIVAKNWTSLEEGDNKTDMSMQVGSKEGKNVDADVYISVRPHDLSKIISSFGTKKFDSIVEDDVYGLVKGKLNIVTQSYSIYDVQASRSAIQEDTFKILSESLTDTYGIELVRFELGTLKLPVDIQAKIDQKTEAINAVELAKLDREKQDEINQKIVDQQKAESEKELVKRQAEADAAAYEKEKASQAELLVAENKVKIAEQGVEVARLEKEAELQRQKSYTNEYFRDKELDVQMKAVQAINSSVKTIITNSDGDGYAALAGLSSILGEIGN